MASKRVLKTFTVDKKWATIDGMMAAVEKVCLLPLVQEIRIRNGQLAYTRIVTDDGTGVIDDRVPDDIVESIVTPYSVIASRVVTEVDACVSDAAKSVIDMMRSAEVERHSIIGFALHPQSSFLSWLLTSREGYVPTLQSPRLFGHHCYFDADIPEDSMYLLVCEHFSNEIADTSYVLRLSVPLPSEYATKKVKL